MESRQQLRRIASLAGFEPLQLTAVKQEDQTEKAINQLEKALKDEPNVSNLNESVILTMPHQKVGL